MCNPQRFRDWESKRERESEKYDRNPGTLITSLFLTFIDLHIHDSIHIAKVNSSTTSIIHNTLYEYNQLDWNRGLWFLHEKSVLGVIRVRRDSNRFVFPFFLRVIHSLNRDTGLCPKFQYIAKVFNSKFLSPGSKCATSKNDFFDIPSKWRAMFVFGFCFATRAITHHDKGRVEILRYSIRSASIVWKGRKEQEREGFWFVILAGLVVSSG